MIFGQNPLKFVSPNSELQSLIMFTSKIVPLNKHRRSLKTGIRDVWIFIKASLQILQAKISALAICHSTTKPSKVPAAQSALLGFAGAKSEAE